MGLPTAIPAISTGTTFLPLRTPSGLVLGVVFADAAAVGAWVGSVNWNGVAATIVAVGVTLTGGYITVTRILRSEQRKRDREQREWEKENADSLTHKLEEITDQLTEANASLKRERESLHAFRDEASTLRNQLALMTSRLLEATEQIGEANRRNAMLLGAQVDRLRVGVVAHTEQVKSAVGGLANQVAITNEAVATLTAQGEAAAKGSADGEAPGT